MASDRAITAHILRRTTFGPFPGQVDEFAKTKPADLIDLIVTAKPEAAPEQLDGKDDYGQRMTTYWLERMLDRRPNLTEKMTWYWHGHLVSSLDKVPEKAMWKQHLLLRRHALGNFRELMKQITVDPAMLFYLDGNGSRGENPNENYAREVMELFMLGQGNYSEADIRGASRAFTGWQVDYETLKLKWNAESAYDRPVEILGLRRAWTADAVIDAICDQPACARFVAERMYRYFVGHSPVEARLDEIAGVFRKNNLEIRPLIENILRGKEFLDALHARPRTPIEWLVPALAITGNSMKKTEQFEFSVYNLNDFGQIPFRPPNVAGWPIDERWLSAGQMLTRTSYASRLPLAKPVIDRVEPTVDGVLNHVGLYDVSPKTRAAMQQAIDQQTEFAKGLELLITLALVSPEFSLL